MKALRSRLTYANVVSTLALFLVIAGGSAIAAEQLRKNSVGSRELKPNAVRTGILAPEAAKGGKIAKNAISTNRLRDNAVTGAKVNEATLGQVPRAGVADSATNAAEAQRLGGLSSAQILAASKLQCPAGTALVGGACFETALRGPATYGTALSTCGKLGRFIPTYSQGWAYQWLTNATLPAENEWVGEYQPKDDGTARAWAIRVASNGSSAGGIYTITESFPYRCVVFPTN